MNLSSIFKIAKNISIQSWRGDCYHHRSTYWLGRWYSDQSSGLYPHQCCNSGCFSNYRSTRNRTSPIQCTRTGIISPSLLHRTNCYRHYCWVRCFQLRSGAWSHDSTPECCSDQKWNGYGIKGKKWRSSRLNGEFLRERIALIPEASVYAPNKLSQVWNPVGAFNRAVKLLSRWYHQISWNTKGGRNSPAAFKLWYLVLYFLWKKSTVSFHQ